MHWNNYYKNVASTATANVHTDQYLEYVRLGLTLKHYILATKCMYVSFMIIFLYSNNWVPFLVQIILFTPEPINGLAKGAVDKSTSLIPQSLQHPFEPNSFALKMKATRSPEKSDKIYHPIRTQKIIIWYGNLKIFNCLPAGTLHQARKLECETQVIRGGGEYVRYFRFCDGVAKVPALIGSDTV